MPKLTKIKRRKRKSKKIIHLVVVKSTISIKIIKLKKTQSLCRGKSCYFS